MWVSQAGKVREKTLGEFAWPGCRIEAREDQSGDGDKLQPAGPWDLARKLGPDPGSSHWLSLIFRAWNSAVSGRLGTWGFTCVIIGHVLGVFCSFSWGQS